MSCWQILLLRPAAGPVLPCGSAGFQCLDGSRVGGEIPSWGASCMARAAWRLHARSGKPYSFGTEAGSCFYWQVKVTIVVGKPIELPNIAEPSREQVQEYLDQFIDQMRALFEKHKTAAGYPELQLTVI